ncbi:MAG: DUF1007 family protein [Alphaproteobacteria bacterium]|nr:DUF1007 family protein [Alphaproteobacteria bacterium]
MQRLIAGTLVWLGLAIWDGARPAQAHPHSWIDLEVSVLFDGEGRATGLRQIWLFDEYYSAFALEGFDRDGDGAPDQALVEGLITEMVGNLADYQYFTEATLGGEAVALGRALPQGACLTENRLEMTVEVPFATPQPVAGRPLRYAVYDPTYYIEILHSDGPASIRLEAAPAGCAATLEEPAPPPEFETLAAALDRNQTAGDTLGQHFAEWVNIACGP